MTKVAEKEFSPWSASEKKELPSLYGCELLFEKTNLQQIKDPSLPQDAYIVVYKVNDNVYMDLCRGTRVKIFDMYYDKFGVGSVQKIDWGYGRVNPKIWSSNNKKQSKRKK